MYIVITIYTSLAASKNPKRHSLIIIITVYFDFNYITMVSVVHFFMDLIAVSIHFWLSLFFFWFFYYSIKMYFTCRCYYLDMFHSIYLFLLAGLQHSVNNYINIFYTYDRCLALRLNCSN